MRAPRCVAYFPPSGRVALLELEAPVPLVPLLVDVSVPLAEPETEPDAEPEIDPDALALSLAGVVLVELEAALSDVVALLDAPDEDVSLIVVLLLCVPREQPGPRASVAARNAPTPSKLRFFLFMIIASRCG